MSSEHTELKAEVITTALTMPGSTLIPAALIAITNGADAAVPSLCPRPLVFEGRTKLITKIVST